MKLSIRFVVEVSSMIALRLYSSWCDEINNIGKVTSPEDFFDFYYLVSNHPTKYLFKSYVMKFFIWEVIGRGTFQKDIEEEINVATMCLQ